MTAMLRVTRAGRAALHVATLTAVLLAIPAQAEEARHSCDVPAYLLSSASALPKVEAALKARGALNVLVVGSRSSSLAPPARTPLTDAAPNNSPPVSAPSDGAYPNRLQAILQEKLPSIRVNVMVDVQAKKSAEEVASTLKAATGAKPDLVIWQTGTVDALRSIDPDEFRSAIDDGVSTLREAGADVILMNLQFSPRTETMTSSSPYIDNMRVVAQQHDIPLFDRFAIMRHWSESGDFDLFSPAPGIDLAQRVHDCLARALSTFVIDAARVNPAELKIQR